MQMVNTTKQYNGKPIGGGFVQIYAHRGCRGLAPENTLLAYKSSLRMGVDYLDMDVHMSKDGEIVVYHNFALNAISTKDEHNKWVDQQPLTFINSLTFAELQRYDVGSVKAGSKYDKIYPLLQGGVTQRISRLKDIIRFVKKYDVNEQVGFVIEIKYENRHRQHTTSPKVFAAKIAEILKEEGIYDRTEVQAFHWECLTMLKYEFKDANDVKTAFLTPHEESDDEFSNMSYPKRIKALGGDCWHAFTGSITEKDIIEAHKEDIKIVAWCDPEIEKNDFAHKTISRLIRWGIDGINTDRPDELRGVLSLTQNLPKGVDV